MKHTNGPWVSNGNRVEPFDRVTQQRGWENDGWVICDCDGPDGEANARLIAASPELYKSLAKLCAMRPKNLCERDDHYEESCPWCQARAAVAKAEGAQ